MRTRQKFLLILFGVLCLWAGSAPARAPQAAALNLPEVFASPINASCILVTPYDCRIHVDPFTIQVDSSQRLEAFQLMANGHLLYDFRTDVSNPPSGSYMPSPVKLDFAAACGRTYAVNLLARDTGDASFLNAGQAENIVCPAAAPTPPGHNLFLPMTSGRE